MTPLERLVTQALRLPLDIVRRIIGLNRAAAERAASTIFQKYTRSRRPRLAFRDMAATVGFPDFGGNNRVRARWWRETWYPHYDSSVPPEPSYLIFVDDEGPAGRREVVAGYRRFRRGALQ
jgi:hypothetical protein